MSYLLDTHYILWTMFEPEKINKRIRAILEDENSIKYVSGICLWEISLKYSIGKLTLEGTDPYELYTTIKTSGFELLEVETDLLASYHTLPKKEKHTDPFDRMLIWQAIRKNLILITNDTKIHRYKEDGLTIVS